MSIFLEEERKPSSNPPSNSTQKLGEEPNHDDHDHRHIPEELFRNILSSVPVGDLARWNLVSKPWSQLISSPEFVHSHRTAANVSRIFLSLPSDHLILDSVGNETKILKPLAKFPGPNLLIVGSCDGLICMLRKDTQDKELEAFIFNPSTGKSISQHLSVNNYDEISFYWFGRGCSSAYHDEYMLVIGGVSWKFMQRGCRFHTAINAFTIIRSGEGGRFFAKSVDEQEIHEGLICCNPFQKMGISLHQYVHWPGYRKIVRYSLVRGEIACDLAVPDSAPHCSPGFGSDHTLGVLSGSLLAMFRNPLGEFELWMMGKYGFRESWTKHRVMKGFQDYDFLLPLGFSLRDGCLIVDADRSKVAKYSFTKEEATVLMVRDCESSEAIMYSESFMSPADMISAEEEIDHVVHPGVLEEQIDPVVRPGVLEEQNDRLVPRRFIKRRRPKYSYILRLRFEEDN